MAVVLVMVSLLSLYVNNVLSERVQEEKAADYSAFVQQLATSLRLVTQETENALFNQYNNNEKSLASLLLKEEQSFASVSGIQACLNHIPLNVSSITSVWAVDLNGNDYFASVGLEDHKDDLSSLLKYNLNEDFTLWWTDERGEIFLKKDIYEPFPLKYAGIIIAHIDRHQLLSSLSLGGHTESMLALFTGKKEPLILTGGMTQELLDQALTIEPLSYMPVNREIALEDGNYYMTMYPAANRSWYALELVPMETMMALPIELSRVVAIASAGIILAALIISFLITHSLSRGTRQLLASMEEISRGNFETNIPVVGRDEIGDLAAGVRWMQGELKDVTAKMIEHATQKQEAEYEMLELKYRSLQSQISPHFICNILSSMNALAVMKRTQEISTLSIKASRYLRANLNGADRKRTSLDSEINFVEEYVDLYHEIYQNPCRFTADVADDAGECLVPNMILQPLVENALIHGYPLDDPDQTHEIALSAQIERNELVILLSDNGQGMSQELIEKISRADADIEQSRQLKGFGLRGVLQRLHLLYGENHTFSINSKPGVMTIITIRIPCQYEGG